MKETGFIKHNIEKWSLYEKELKKKKKAPDQISKLFIQITDDLSYAQTYYRNRSVRLYLNGIAQLLFNDINKSRKIKFKSFMEFWTIELPVVLYKARYELFFSFALFLAALTIGLITSIYEPDFARTILGDSYIDMTIENIESGDPMKVYKEMNELDMFLGITLNNIQVALLAFVLGIFFGIGTFYILLYNGIMLGTFQYFFIEKGLFKESFLTIWQHGSLEISAIIIAGAAGFTIGRGLILPGTYTRFQSLRITAKRALIIWLGLLPVFIMAGFIEGYFTRHTEAPDTIRALTIILSFAFIVFYFVIYPWAVSKKHKEKLSLDEKISLSSMEMPNLTKILNGEQLFGGTLKIFKEMMPKISVSIILIAIIGSLTISLGAAYLIPGQTGNFLNARSITDILDYSSNPLMFITNTVLITALLAGNMIYFQSIAHKKMNESKTYYINIKSIINCLIVSLVLNVPFFLEPGWAIFIWIILFPFLILILKDSYERDKFILKATGSGLKNLNRSFSVFLLLNSIYSVLGSLVIFLLSPLILRKLYNLILWNLWLTEQSADVFINFILAFVFFSAVFIAISIIITANNLLFYTMKEKSTDFFLRKRIKDIGIKNTIRGYEIEY